MHNRSKHNRKYKRKKQRTLMHKKIKKNTKVKYKIEILGNNKKRE